MAVENDERGLNQQSIIRRVLREHDGKPQMRKIICVRLG
ncbi:hypothetical protein I552_5424 [Mycobacterium xenopi 3993]|nr:hypothetical protein I552_5424 [Mycobacterium xenopi 3993]